MKKKVSVLTPCFNSEKYIHRLLNSILSQTYPNIEMIVINDGSTDRTEEVVISYIPRFEEKGYTLQCVYQENQGQGAAINNGLKLIQGEYLVWPDSDDYYANNNAIEEMVNVLNDKLDFSMVRTFTNILDEDSLEKIGEYGGNDYIKNRKTDLFLDCLFVKNGFWFGAGNYMLRVKTLFETYTNKDIYTSTKFGGQNWQLLLPLLYQKKCYTIEKNLYNVLARKDSHSRGTYISVNDKIKKYEELRNILFHTLKSISEEVYNKYYKEIHIKYEVINIRLLASENKKEAFKKYRKRSLKKNYKIKDHLRIIYSLVK